MVWLRGDRYREALAKARHEPHALLACNATCDSTIRAFCQAAENKHSDIIIQVSASAAKFASGSKQDMCQGLKIISDSIKNISKQYKIGTAIHIDHAKPEHLDMVHFALDNDLVSSVMIDFSAEEYETNVNITKEIVEKAHSKDVLVEAELGRIKGKEDEVVSEETLYTKPDEALDFVKRTNVDLFACSIGTNHGITKGKDITLRTDILEDVHNILLKNDFHTSLVLHGASGLTEEQQTDCITKGVVKINKDTRFQQEFATKVNQYWQDNADAIKDLDKKRFDPRVWLKLGEEAMQKACEELMDIVKSSNKMV